MVLKAGGIMNGRNAKAEVVPAYPGTRKFLNSHSQQFRSADRNAAYVELFAAKSF